MKSNTGVSFGFFGVYCGITWRKESISCQKENLLIFQEVFYTFKLEQHGEFAVL